ncbi:RCC1/BLIP-II [Paxillus ammoniavirescens]|nr:RCC1/BLIP-II [Paxillus ammoniavirescens]
MTVEQRRVLLTAGSNAKGQLGIGSCEDAHIFMPCKFANCEPDQLPASTSRVVRVACGANHTILLLEHFDGVITLWGIGDGTRGQLGPEYEDPETPLSGSQPIFRKLMMPLSASYSHLGYTYKLIAAAWDTTFVVLSCPGRSDVLISMGANDFGALGVGEEGAGSASHPSVPRVVNFDGLFADSSKEGTEPRPICIQSLHAGPRHVIVQLQTVTSDAGVTESPPILAGWGASRHGQLGQNVEARFINCPTRIPINIQKDRVVSCAVGNQHTLVLHESGRISALGSNKQGQLPSHRAWESAQELGCTWNGTYVLLMDGDKHVLLAMGNNAQGQLGRGNVTESASATIEAVKLPAEHTISAFACGSEHLLVMSGSSEGNSTSVLGWGWNEHGNLGLGTLGNVALPTRLWPREDVEEYSEYPQKIVSVWAGCATSWLVVE